MIKLIKFFTGVDIESLRNQLESLEKRIEQLENPFKFEIGCKVTNDFIHLDDLDKHIHIVTKRYSHKPPLSTILQNYYIIVSTRTGESIVIYENDLLKWRKV